MATSMPDSRLLGPLERYSAFRSHLGIYLNVCVTASYVIRSDQPLEATLMCALSVVVAKHYILSTTIVDIETSPKFIPLERAFLEEAVTFIEYDNVIPAPGDPEVDKFVEHQHNLPFMYQKPPAHFWRMSVFHNPKKSGSFTICFCFHHSLADTKSALVIHEELEAALSSTSMSSRLAEAEPPTKSLLPPLEAVFDLKTSNKFLQDSQSLIQPPDNVWSGERQSLPVYTRFSSLWIPKSRLHSLRNICKSQNVTLTAAIMTLTASALFHILPSNYTSLWGDCAVSLRHLLPHPITEKSVGCYVGSFSANYDRSATSFQQDAVRTMDIIDRLRQQNGQDMPVGCLRHINDMSQWLSDKIGKKRRAAWELSNVGALSQTTTNGSCQIQNVLFSQSASACSGAIKISVVTGRDGKMGLGFTWQSSVVEESTVMALIKKMNDLINELMD